MQAPIVSASTLFMQGRERAYALVRETHAEWESFKSDPSMKPIAAFRVALTLSLLDLHEAVITTLLTTTPELTPNKELDFVTKASCRMLAFRVYEQRAALYQFQQVIKKMLKHEETKIDYSNFEAICKLNRPNLAYVLKLKDIRNATGHYRNDHTHTISLVEDIEPVKVIECSGALIRCYTAFWDVLNQAKTMKMLSAKKDS